MTELYICNKVTDKCKKFCPHAEPHEEQDYEDAYCTKWGDCFFEGKYIRVRCVKVK